MRPASRLSLPSARGPATPHLELIQRAYDETTPMRINHRAAFGRRRFGQMIDSQWNGTVRASKTEAFDLAYRWLHFVNEGVTLTALDVDRFVRDRSGLRSFVI
jgi:hypothetical protein